MTPQPFVLAFKTLCVLVPVGLSTSPPLVWCHHAIVGVSTQLSACRNHPTGSRSRPTCFLIPWLTASHQTGLSCDRISAERPLPNILSRTGLLPLPPPPYSAPAQHPVTCLQSTYCPEIFLSFFTNLLILLITCPSPAPMQTT